MRKGLILFKRLVAIFLVLLFSINTFAAIVGDNDGAAFITKAEFDSMKNDFQSQLDRYNSSLDNKIDGAIASYLSGLRISKKSIYQLDKSCGYSFPLVAFYGSTKDLWNAAETNYYSLSVPKLISRNIGTNVSRLQSDRGIDVDADLWVAGGNYGPFSIPPSHLNTAHPPYHGIRAGWHDITIDYPGLLGNLYRIDKTSGATREINGTNHSIWALRDRIYGQDNLYYLTTAFAAPWDGENKSLNYWYDMIFVGYNSNHPWNDYPKNGAWNSTIATEHNTWTQDNVKASIHHNRLWTTLKPESSHYRNQWTTMADAKTAYSSVVVDLTGAGAVPSTGNWLGQPWTRVLNIVNSGKNRMIFAGDANVPSYNDAGFSFAPVRRTTSENNTKITYSKLIYQFRDKQAFWNFHTASQTAGNYQNMQYVAFPEWRATEKNSFEQDTSNTFSMIRASLVYYYDKNNKVHFMDEGMFLGTYEEDCTVEFSLNFNSTAASQISLGLSKKPWDINHQASNIPAWSYKVGSTETNVPAGSTATVPTNTVIQVKVPDILKGEELYMIWNPPGTEYVELTSFDDYYVTTEG